MGQYPLNPFPFGWFFAVYADDLPSSTAQPLVLHARYFVLWRDDHGTPPLSDAYYAHPGAHLGYGGRVNGAMIRCPIHVWTYDVHGRCVEFSYSNRRLPGHATLTNYPVAERNGMIWIWWHPLNDSPTFAVPAVPGWANPLWTDTDVQQDWRVCTPWREIAENGIDLTHFHYLSGVLTISKLNFVSTDGPRWHSKSSLEVRTLAVPQPSRFEALFHGPGFG